MSRKLLLICGIASSSANLAANLPTPWMGVMERISIFTYLAWVAILAIVLMRHPGERRGVDNSMLAA